MRRVLGNIGLLDARRLAGIKDEEFEEVLDLRLGGFLADFRPRRSGGEVSRGRAGHTQGGGAGQLSELFNKLEVLRRRAGLLEGLGCPSLRATSGRGAWAARCRAGGLVSL